MTGIKWLSGIPSWILSNIKISFVWALAFIPKPHDDDDDDHHDHDHPVDIEAQGVPILHDPDPIVKILREQELGKTILGFVVPMTTALLSVYSKDSTTSSFFMHFPLLSLSIGLAALWNGILLRETFPRVANGIEQLGAAFILLTFYGVISSFLPTSLVWGSWLCFALSVLPFFLSYLPIRERTPLN